ncbi:hypothetical protein HMPREF9718_01202 [Sphingobium yanoikuyae ATCC 51230]|uniref:Uncharacterized protein n=1 Tax=Sphingobium yanoikuyae ATCC 51230 TaxID=883163 RepID=K9DEH4_SPHYA|nr:hypothetical protein HMPREF9718_01202 [Sphingobium yanoikuyae ATCC 51230]
MVLDCRNTDANGVGISTKRAAADQESDLHGIPVDAGLDRHDVVKTSGGEP